MARGQHCLLHGPTALLISCSEWGDSNSALDKVASEHVTLIAADTIFKLHVFICKPVLIYFPLLGLYLNRLYRGMLRETNNFEYFSSARQYKWAHSLSHIIFVTSLLNTFKEKVNQLRKVR